MKPPRTSNLWLAASASAGASRSVGVWKFDQRMRGHGTACLRRHGTSSGPGRRRELTVDEVRAESRSLAFHDAVPFRIVGYPNGSAKKRKARRFSEPLPRLTTPMIRENGSLRDATWDEALSHAAAGFAAVRDEHGPEGFAVFSCSKSTNEMNYAAQKFARMALGTNNIDSCNRT